MLRLEAEDGWWLVTHPEHARLAGDFAAHWGNELFAPPEPRGPVLHAIYAHDDGWLARDAEPNATSQGIPAAFSTELVGKYSAFEEIDLRSYLAVRRQAVQAVAQEDPYAAILISMHTYNLLAERADRSTIKPEELGWLDAFLVEQKTLQSLLRGQLLGAKTVAVEHLLPRALHTQFTVLQACDNLSLLSCVDYSGDATLLHPFRLSDGAVTDIAVARLRERSFCLAPYPFDEEGLVFPLHARFVHGRTMTTDELRERFEQAPLQTLEVRVTAW